MAVDDPGVRMRLRNKLEELVGVEEADLLMDRPPGGWSALVTNETLDLKFGALEARMNARFEGVEYRFEGIDQRFESLEARMDRRLSSIDSRLDTVNQAFAKQTWRLGGLMIGLGAVIVAALRV